MVILCLFETGVNKQHRPTVSANKCNCYAGSTKVKFHGGASWLYNLFSSKIEDVLKRQLQGKVNKQQNIYC